MISLTVNISGGELGNVLIPEQRREMAREAANGVLNLVTDHLLGNGGKSFWADAAGSTKIEEVTPTGATVGIYQRGVALQRYGSGGLPGGVVTPKRAKHLAIPVPPATGAASQYKGSLVCIPARRPGQYAGALFPASEKQITRGKNKGKSRKIPQPGSEPLFILLNWTKHNPHPDVLPDHADMQAAATNAARAYINILIHDLS